MSAAFGRRSSLYYGYMDADKTITVVDSEGVTRRVVGGRPVPTFLREAYAEATKAEQKPAKTKRQRKSKTTAQLAPEKDKAQRAPEDMK